MQKHLKKIMRKVENEENSIRNIENDDFNKSM